MFFLGGVNACIRDRFGEALPPPPRVGGWRHGVQYGCERGVGKGA